MARVNWRRSSLDGLWAGAQFRLFPATTRTFTKFVNQNVTAFWDVFNSSDDDGESKLYGI